MNGYILCYASITGEDTYFYTDVKAFDNINDAQTEFKRQIRDCFRDCEESHGKGNWYSTQDEFRSFKLDSADGRDHWCIEIKHVCD